MAELRCAVESCTYNKGKRCCKGDIMVGGKNAHCTDETCCESFLVQREGFDGFVSAVERPNPTISIDCDAVKCYYNSNYKCVAEHVDIKGDGACGCRETSCATFQERG